MKKLSLLLALLLVTGSLGTTAFAITMDHSFTYTSTAGMFEDMYDFFKYSPAYIPSFQKNVFWGQFSNLENVSDYQINNYTTNAGSYNSNYYLLGGQMDLMGAGRGGLMLDWNGRSQSQSVTDFNGNPGTGFQESTVVNYTTSDGHTIDGKSETYGRAKQINNQAGYDVYAAYGLGGIAGIDLGAAVRGTNWDANPTYDPFWGGSSASVGYTFDGAARVRTYNLLSGATTSTFDRTQTGSLDYANTNWRLILAGRAKNLVPYLDLVANLGPIINSNTNKIKADRADSYDYQPGGPTSTKSLTENITGAEVFATADYGFTGGNSVPMLPGSGLGVLANVRGDYSLTPSITLIGEAGMITQPMTLSSDAKLDYAYNYNTKNQAGSNLLGYDDTYNEHYKYSGTIANGQTYAKLRSQLASGKNWKLGAGLNYTYSYYKSDLKKTYNAQEVYTSSGNPVPGNNYVQTVNYQGYEEKDIYEMVDSTVELPLGLVFNFLDNLPVRFGVKHAISYTATSNSTEVTSRTPQNSNTVYGDGATANSVSGTSTTDGDNESVYNITHRNSFFYGASWWRYSNVQIDFTGFAGNVLALTNYQLSFNLYFSREEREMNMKRYHNMFLCLGFV
ncbi:MAG: hypothetical protein HGA76_10700, partial [Candidatus Firestonebacteria bacterium]|nr:hypothetical protein [Candidatus Firestonebacteria bacterium]